MKIYEIQGVKQNYLESQDWKELLEDRKVHVLRCLTGIQMRMTLILIN